MNVMLDTLLTTVDAGVSAALRAAIEAEVREANERGYRAGFEDARNAAAIAVEAIRIEDE